MKNVFLLVACCLLTSSLAFSQTQQGQTQQIRAKTKLIHGAPTTCPNDPVLVSDGTEASDDLIFPATAAFYALNVIAGHSYSVEVYDHVDTTAGVSAVIKVTSDCSTPIPGVMDVSDVDPDLSGGFSDRVSWIQGSPGQIVYIGVMNSDPASAYTYNIRVTDTTQINPRWSTFGIFDTQWGFTNTTSSPITGTLTVYKFDGTVAKVITQTIQAGQFLNVPARANGVPSGIYGNAVYTYVGPAGAILSDAVLINSSSTVIVPYKFEGKHAYH